MEIKKAKVKIKIVLMLFLLIAITLLYPVKSHLGIDSISEQNISMCNVQGYVFDEANVGIKNHSVVQCILARNNGIITTYAVHTGEGVLSDAADTASGANRYRCTMMCSNVLNDNITVFAFNATGNGTASSTMLGSSTFVNVTFDDYESPVIEWITGNASGTTGDVLEINVNASDNAQLNSGYIMLDNGSIFTLNQSVQTQYAAYTINITMPSNSTEQISYYAVIFDSSGNNYTSDNYYITVIDNDAPIAIAGDDIVINENTNATFNALPSTDNIGIAAYSWNFGDSSATDAKQITSHNFTAPGVYTTTLTVTDEAGNNGNDTMLVVVTEAKRFKVISTFPLNNSVNVSRKTGINLTFSNAVSSDSLSDAFFQITDAEGNNVYGDLSLESSANKTIFMPYVLLKESALYVVNATSSIKDNDGASLADSHIFTFTTAKQDTDDDGIPDEEEADSDNDGVIDEFDKVNGDATDINTELTGIVVSFNLSTNLSDVSLNSNATYDVLIYELEQNNPLVKFSIDLSLGILDLSNISIKKSANESIGEMLVHGLKLSSAKKTVYLDKKNNNNSICIKDSEIDSFALITQSCDAAGETKVECDGTVQNSYVCTYNSSINKYAITGLSNSGVREIDYAKEADDDSNGDTGGDTGNEEDEENSDDAEEDNKGNAPSVSPSAGSGGGGGSSKVSETTTPIQEEKPEEEAYIEEENVVEEREEGSEENIPEIIKDDESSEKMMNNDKTKAQQNIEKGARTLTGRAIDVLSENKGNAIFLLFITVILVSIAIFNSLAVKNKDNGN